MLCCLSAYAMLYPSVCECRTVSHDVCKAMGGSVTMYEGFVDKVINPFEVH